MKQEAERRRKALKWRSTSRNVAAGLQRMQCRMVWRHLCMKLRQAMKQAEERCGRSVGDASGVLVDTPLGHDFAVIVLKDLLTPWEKIENVLNVRRRLISRYVCTIRQVKTSMII